MEVVSRGSTFCKERPHSPRSKFVINAKGRMFRIFPHNPSTISFAHKDGK